MEADDDNVYFNEETYLPKITRMCTNENFEV